MSELQPGAPLLLEATPAPALQLGNQRSLLTITLLRQRLYQSGIGWDTGRRQEVHGDVTVAYRRRQLHHGTQFLLELLSAFARKELAEYPQALRQPADGDAQVVDGVGVTVAGRPVRLERQPPQQCRRLPGSMIAYEDIHLLTLYIPSQKLPPVRRESNWHSISKLNPLGWPGCHAADGCHAPDHPRIHRLPCTRDGLEVKLVAGDFD